MKIVGCACEAWTVCAFIVCELFDDPTFRTRVSLTFAIFCTALVEVCGGAIHAITQNIVGVIPKSEIWRTLKRTTTALLDAASLLID